jgi:hypothetical protein
LAAIAAAQNRRNLKIGTSIMGPHIEKNISCWKAYSRIVDASSLIEALAELSPKELQSGLSRVCETPEYSERAMTLDEVAFCAGVSTGLSLARSVEEGLVDPGDSGEHGGLLSPVCSVHESCCGGNDVAGS